MCADVPYFIILLYLTPDNFTHQGERAATQWVDMQSRNWSKIHSIANCNTWT